jgi:hypothetical protein
MIPRDVLERALGEALGHDATSAAGDADMLDRLIDGALHAPPAPPPTTAATKLAYGAGTVMAAVGAVVLAMRLLGGAPATPAVAPEIVATSHAATAADTKATAPAMIEAPTVSPDALPVATAEPTTHAATPTPMTAAGLFARANGERRAGRDDAAIADYRALERDHAGTPEAEASLVALGRLLLDKHADYTDALAQFDRYLATSRSGALREEALIGRALALEHLGRSGEEEGAWRAVLDTYPDSIYASEAHARLEALAR